MKLLDRLFRREEKENIKPCCDLCRVSDMVKPKIENKPYAKSLWIFLMTPTDADKIYLKERREIGEEDKNEGELGKAVDCYYRAVALVLQMKNVSNRYIRKRLREYMEMLEFSKSHKFTPDPASYGDLNDCLVIMENLDEIRKIITPLYVKILKEKEKV